MKKYYIFIFLNLLASAAFSQIKGTVTDAVTHEALTGAVISDGTKSLTQTNTRGEFSVAQSSLTTIKVSMVGYTPRTIIAVDGASVNVELEPSTTDLQTVIVSANREGQDRRDAPMAISKINSTQMKDTKATALYQLINKTPGVYMVNLGNEQHTMSIRQPITYNALYLYMEDGLPIRPTGIFNHNSLYEINMSGVKDIEVIKGPASSLYGSNAIGGAINFITQSPPAGYAGNVSVQGDNYNYRRVDADGGFTKGKFGLYVGGYGVRQKNGWQDYSDFDKNSINLKMTYAATDRTKLTFASVYNYLNTQTPGSLDATKFYSRSYGSNQRFTYRRVKAFRASLKLERNWSEKSSTFILHLPVPTLPRNCQAILYQMCVVIQAIT